MVENKVRLRPDAALCGAYPELIDEVGILSVDGDNVLNVRFSRPAKIVLLNVAAADFECVE